MAEKKKDTVHDLLPGPGEDSAFKPKPEKTCCGGVGPDVFVIFMHAVLLGIDYTILLSASAQYYAHLLLGDSAHDNVTASPLDVNHTTLNVSDGFCEPGSSKSDSLYSEQQSYWALAQLVGCICGIFLPKLVGYKGSFLMFTSMIFLGNLLYALSTVQLLDSWRLAMTGRIISGLGDGSIVLGLSYIPLRIKKIPIMRTALVNYRMYVAVGTTIGSILSIGASRLTDPTTAEIDADFSFNPANIAGFLMSLLALLLFVCEAVLVAPFKPPTQRGAVCSPHWSWKILAWLFFVFTYGMLMGAIQYASAIFCFYADNAADLGTFQAIVLTISFFFALLGALTSSFITGPCCAKRVPKDVNLKLVQWLCLVIIAGICFIYAAEKLQGSPSTIGTSAIMVAGDLIFFFGVTGLSAAKTPLFKKIVPRSAISATMPLYKIMLDCGKAVGPFWSEASMDAGVIDTAFGPYLALFVVIMVFLFWRGVWMTTPDKEEEAFCYKPQKQNSDALIGGVGEFDSAAGGGLLNKRENVPAAVTRGYADVEFEEDEAPTRNFVQLTGTKLDAAAYKAAADSDGYAPGN